MIVARPAPDTTLAPAVEVSSARGKTVRSSTHWWLGTPTALSVVPVGVRSTTPCTQAGWPYTRYRPSRAAGRGSVIDAVRFGSDADQLWPQTFRFTSATSS